MLSFESIELIRAIFSTLLISLTFYWMNFINDITRSNYAVSTK